MNQIKKFIDKVALAEGRQSRELLMPINDAKELRDEIAKLLLENRDTKSEPVIEVVMNGGKW